MDRQPVLMGERLVLRPLRRDDWPALFAVAADPLIWEQHPVHDRWREDVFCSFFDEAIGAGGALVAIRRSDGAVIGSRVENRLLVALCPGKLSVNGNYTALVGADG